MAIFYASDGERSGECWRAGNGEISDQITVQITGWGGVARAHCRQVKAIARSAVHSHCIEEERACEGGVVDTICVCNSLVLSIDFSRHTTSFLIHFICIFSLFPKMNTLFRAPTIFPHHQVIQKPSFLVVAFFKKCALESLFMLGRFDLGDQKA